LMGKHSGKSTFHLHEQHLSLTDGRSRVQPYDEAGRY
jgi:hypothetical protein